MESPSRTKRVILGTIGGLGIFAGAAGIAAAATSQSAPPTTAAATQESDRQQEAPEATYKSSVTAPDNGPEKSDAEEAAQLKSLAKITEDQAKSAATAAVPGTVVKVELENEDGNVVYDIHVKGVGGEGVGSKTTEVKVDAGDGKVLHQEAEDADEHDGNDSEATTAPAN